MTAGIIIPLLVIPLAVVVAFSWYRRKMAAMNLDDDDRTIPGTRLTSETLRRLPSPPWRVVVEIAPDQLEGIDHVVIGPAGVIAVTTVVADRPAVVVERDPMTVATGAIARAAIGSMTAAHGHVAIVSARVFWGAAETTQPPARVDAHGSFDVEGQRLIDWLHSLPPALPGGQPITSSQVDDVWTAVLTGIGRPDPLV